MKRRSFVYAARAYKPNSVPPWDNKFRAPQETVSSPDSLSLNLLGTSYPTGRQPFILACCRQHARAALPMRWRRLATPISRGAALHSGKDLAVSPFGFVRSKPRTYTKVHPFRDASRLSPRSVAARTSLDAPRRTFKHLNIAMSGAKHRGRALPVTVLPSLILIPTFCKWLNFIDFSTNFAVIQIQFQN